MDQEQTSVGAGGVICGYCGRPMAAGVVIGGRMYHEECTHGPGWTPPVHVPEGVPLSDLIRKWREDPEKKAYLDAARIEFRGWLAEELQRLGLLKIINGLD